MRHTLILTYFLNSFRTFYHSFLSDRKFISNEDANVRNVDNTNANKETPRFLVFVLLFCSFVSAFRLYLFLFLSLFTCLTMYKDLSCAYPTAYRLCGLMVRVSGYRSRGPYQIF
jgi:hypothetical protein